MSLLGRLEDLSLPDIIQIVFLSRRTGILEIIESGRRWTVHFNHGLIVNVSTPDDPDLASYLEKSGALTAEQVATMTSHGDGAVGDRALVEAVLSPELLAELIEKRVVENLSSLLVSREGEFNFILSERIDSAEIGYDCDSLFQMGGIAPQVVLGGDGVEHQAGICLERCGAVAPGMQHQNGTGGLREFHPYDAVEAHYLAECPQWVGVVAVERGAIAYGCTVHFVLGAGGNKRCE